MPDRTIAITDAEARLAAQGKLGALVRVCKYDIQQHYDSSWSVKKPGFQTIHLMHANDVQAHLLKKSPFPAPGQPLGLKETWADLRGLDMPSDVMYKADALKDDGTMIWMFSQVFNDCALSWRSPVTMPARFIRHRPTVQEVRAVQICRMQPEDAIALGFSTKLREHDAVCHLREQVAEYYHIEPSTWVWFARLEWPS